MHGRKEPPGVSFGWWQPDLSSAGGRRYAVALLSVAAALLFRWGFQGWFGGNVPYLQFVPAVLVAAWFGGFGPGVLATALSTLAAMYFFLPPAGFAIGGVADLTSLVFFVVIGVGVSWLNYELRRTAILVGSSEARWKAIVDTAVDGIIVIDKHGHVETFNPAAERLFGYAASEVIARNVDMLMPSPYREEHDGYLARYLATGRARIIGTGREVQGRRKDGTTFPLHLSVGEINQDGERKFAGILHDLTGRVQMEVRLREQAALAKLGEMAAVIAHEVKNPLAGIRGAVQIFGSQMPEHDGRILVLKEIVARIDALDQMIKDLLYFARPPKPRRSPTDVVLLVTSTAKFLSEDPALKQVGIDVEGSVPPLSADPDMLRIVFQNLLINSAHAMQGNGRIRIAVRANASNCEIAFTDNGPGIPSEIREKIFTPFFTTKSRGSGLGLATAKRLVEAHGGQIEIECPPTGGTLVVIRLPMGRA